MIILPIENTGKVSDGYHTFDELYEHRIHLFLALMKLRPDISWIAQKHNDGSFMTGWFIAGMCLPSGQITYHLPLRFWEVARNLGVKTLEVGLKWDGHTSADVLKRLANFLN